MRYWIAGVLLLTGCATMDRIVFGEVTLENERELAATKCPAGQEARLVGTDGVARFGWQVMCLPIQAPSTQSPTHPALSESQRR